MIIQPYISLPLTLFIVKTRTAQKTLSPPPIILIHIKKPTLQSTNSTERERERETPIAKPHMRLSNMGEGDEREPCFSTLKFPYLPLPAATMLSPKHPSSSGMATPPLQTLASVPFKWEEQPGKPRPCTDIVVRPQPAKCLELPPCRMVFMEPACKITKVPSPNAVLDGPYNLARPKFSSFRLFREAHRSFDSSSSSGGSSPRSSGDVLLGKKKTRRFFGRSLMRIRSGREEADGGSFGFSPSSTTGCDTVERYTMEGRMRRNESFSSFSQPASTHLWVTMYESLKQAIPWKRTRKSKKERRV